MPSQKLTDKTIRGLKCAVGQIDVWDELMPGFGVRVGAGGRKSFIVGTRINGTYKRITLKPAYPVLEHLRRTFATQLRSLGVDRLVVSKLLNHAEAGVTKVYDRYAADPEKVAAMERWANRLREIISGEPKSSVVAFGAR
jgi:integrase